MNSKSLYDFIEEIDVIDDIILAISYEEQILNKNLGENRLQYPFNMMDNNNNQLISMKPSNQLTLKQDTSLDTLQLFSADQLSSSLNYYKNIEHRSNKSSSSLDKNLEEQDTEVNNIQKKRESVSQNDYSVSRQPDYESFIFQQRANDPHLLLKSQKKFYLYLDQVIDLDYFKNMNDTDKYIRENQSQRLYNGLRFINKVVHRLDNKSIEINMESYESKIETIDFLIEYLKALGNKDVFAYANQLSSFKISCQNYQQKIYKQFVNPLFQIHYRSRQLAANAKFQLITSQLDQSKYIQYSKLSINYEKQLVESTVTGFTPALFELLSLDSYTFKDQILKYGYFDPITNQARYNYSLGGAINYLNAAPLTNIKSTKNHFATIEIITCDNFKFPVELKISRIVLDEEYDQQNNLDFEFRDILNIYEFSFKDKKMQNQFLEVRRSQRLKEEKLETINDQIFNYEDFDYEETDFYNKYYGDQLDNLLKNGNKWFKRCGYMDIPKKKHQKQSILNKK